MIANRLPKTVIISGGYTQGTTTSEAKSFFVPLLNAVQAKLKKRYGSQAAGLIPKILLEEVSLTTTQNILHSLEELRLTAETETILHICDWKWKTRIWFIWPKIAQRVFGTKQPKLEVLGCWRPLRPLTWLCDWKAHWLVETLYGLVQYLSPRLLENDLAATSRTP
jgi:hypothetical protein